MPNLDGTGPNGSGPMTGRAAGPCIGRNSSGRTFGRGKGFSPGRGRGRGFGLRAGFCPFYSQQPVDESGKESLSRYEQALQEELKEVQSLLNKDS